jgi:hypothetical protein
MRSRLGLGDAINLAFTEDGGGASNEIGKIERVFCSPILGSTPSLSVAVSFRHGRAVRRRAPARPPSCAIYLLRIM